MNEYYQNLLQRVGNITTKYNEDTTPLVKSMALIAEDAETVASLLDAENCTIWRIKGCGMPIVSSCTYEHGDNMERHTPPSTVIAIPYQLQ